MEGKRARILIAISEGRFELEGEQEFVDRQIEAFKEHLNKSLAKMVGNAKPAGTPAAKGDAPITPVNGAGLAGYENLFAVNEDGAIQILKTPPGSTVAEKAVNVALLVTLAKKLLGVNVVPFDDVQPVCQSHACLDSGNFAKTMRAEKQDLLVAGKPRSLTLALTVPGQQRATALAASLNAAA